MAVPRQRPRPSPRVGVVAVARGPDRPRAARRASACSEASDRAAPTPTREAYLSDPARLRRVDATLKSRRESDGSDRRERRAPDPGARGEGRRVPAKGSGRGSRRGGASSRRGGEEVAGAGKLHRGGGERSVAFVAGGGIGGDAEGGFAEEISAASAAVDASREGGAEGGAEEGDRPSPRGRDRRRVGGSPEASSPEGFVASREPPRRAYPEGFAAFEKHSTGFAGRMMAKMGHVAGRGLGPEGRGVAEPVEAAPRERRRGLGAG